MTEAASLNFGPAWLRDSFSSNTAGEGPPGSGSGGGPSNHNSQQNNSGWDIASSRSSHGHGRTSNSQQMSQANFQMNLHVEGQPSSGTSSMLSAMKLGNLIISVNSSTDVVLSVNSLVIHQLSLPGIYFITRLLYF